MWAKFSVLPEQRVFHSERIASPGSFGRQVPRGGLSRPPKSVLWLLNSCVLSAVRAPGCRRPFLSLFAPSSSRSFPFPHFVCRHDRECSPFFLYRFEPPKAHTTCLARNSGTDVGESRKAVCGTESDPPLIIIQAVLPPGSRRQTHSCFRLLFSSAHSLRSLSCPCEN